MREAPKVSIGVCVYLWVLYLIPLAYISVFVPVPYCLGNCSFVLVWSQEFTSISSHIHSWVVFLLWLCLSIFSGVISPLIFSSILGTYQPGEVIFQCPIFLPFMKRDSWGSQGKNTELVCHSLLQWTTFCQDYIFIPGTCYPIWQKGFCSCD